jgi:ATP/ADP translocase
MLYIPMKPEEKFNAKAFIDVFVYRGAKIFASLFVMVLQVYFTASLGSFLSWIMLLLCLCWVFIIISIKDSYADRAQSVWKRI